MAESVVAPGSTAAVQPAEDLFSRCAWASFRPSFYSFYGEAESILAKMDAIPERLSDLRTFIFAIENADSAEVKLFERVDGDRWAVSSWRGASIGDLTVRLADAAMDNQGVLCVGEQLKGLLTTTLDVQLDGIVGPPASARAAFGHSVRALAESRFARATTALLC